MKLYKVKIKGGYSTTSMNYNEAYVVTDNPTAAYNKYRKYLDKGDICFGFEREMKSITLIADVDQYNDCHTLLFI